MEQKRLLELAALGEVSAEIVHELRNALLVISASTFLAQKDPEKSAPHLAKVERHVRVAQGIVDGMMALVRGDALPREEVRLAEVLASARAGAFAVAPKFDDALPDDCKVHAHAALLSRVFRVLYENAAQASAPRAANVTTRAVVRSGRVVVHVEDDGPGIPDAIAGSLFQPLVSARVGGTGLGLALARRIVVAHGGTIELESPKHARFRVELD